MKDAIYQQQLYQMRIQHMKQGMFSFQDEMYRSQEEKIKDMQSKYLGLARKKAKSKTSMPSQGYAAYVGASMMLNEDSDAGRLGRRMLRIQQQETIQRLFNPGGLKSPIN